MKMKFRNSIYNKEKKRIFHLCFIAAICCVLICGLAACGTESSNKAEYHNEVYGFSLSIPDDIYKNITTEEKLTDTDVGSIDFIYSKEHEDGSVSSGILFSIKIYNKAKYTNMQDTDSIKVVGKNDSYYFCFETITEPIEDMGFAKIYEENKDKILKIGDTFKLD